MNFGAFEASLRGRDSPSVDRRMLHKGCSGHLHGHGVKKERSVRDIPAVSRHVHHDTSSSDESDLHLIARKRQIPAVCARSQSSDCHLNNNSIVVAGHTVAKRSSSAVVAQRLYSSPTKATTAKQRAERAVSDSRKMTAEMRRLTEKAGLLSATMSAASGASSSTSNLATGGGGGARLSRWGHRLQDEANDPDSGHFSSASDTEGAGAGGARMHFVRSMMTPTPEERKKNVIHGVSDDEFSMLELRKRQRKERRDYVHGRSPKGSPCGGPGSRKESPSPGPKRYHPPGDRGRRSSDELSSTSASPPTTPTPRSASSRPSSREGFHYGTVPGRRSTSFGTTPVSKKAISYAFGSSVKRFPSSKRLNLELPPSLGPHGRHRSAPLHAVRSVNNNGYGSDAEHHSQQRNLSLGRTISCDPPSRSGHGGGGGGHVGGSSKSARERQRDVVTKAWLQFKDDVENALLKKPNHTGLYKNLTDMMHTKMEMLNDESNEVGDRMRRRDGRCRMHLPPVRDFLTPRLLMTSELARALGNRGTRIKARKRLAGRRATVGHLHPSTDNACMHSLLGAARQVGRKDRASPNVVGGNNSRFGVLIKKWKGERERRIEWNGLPAVELLLPSSLFFPAARIVTWNPGTRCLYSYCAKMRMTAELVHFLAHFSK